MDKEESLLYSYKGRTKEIMFTEFQNQTWTPSDASVVIANNTDTSIDGSSKFITWTAAQNEYVTLSFDAVDLSQYEEISFHVYARDVLTEDDLFRITVDGNDYDFAREELRPGYWKHILIDCTSMGSASSIVITSLVTNLYLMIDYIGYRKVTYNMDVDIITALKSHINLDYDVETTLSAAITAGDESVSLTSWQYINDSSLIEVDDGAGTTEQVELLSRGGGIKEAFTNSFSNGSTVRVLCPARGEDIDTVEPDPVCGIKIFDFSVEKTQASIPMKDSSKMKENLGKIGLCIYIDCSSKKKCLQLSREFNKKYGWEFQFLLDGEQVDIYLESSLFNDGIIGSNPRVAYYYRFQPQPYTLAIPVPIDTFTITPDSEEL